MHLYDSSVWYRYFFPLPRITCTIYFPISTEIANQATNFYSFVSSYTYTKCAHTPPFAYNYKLYIILKWPTFGINLSAVKEFIAPVHCTVYGTRFLLSSLSFIRYARLLNNRHRKINKTKKKSRVSHDISKWSTLY